MDQPETLPQSGGSYSRDPETGELLPLTPPPADPAPVGGPSSGREE
jgi:hypothetical protein